MIKKDYIERLTQQIAALLAELMGKETKEALEIIDKAYDIWLKLSRKELLALGTNELFILLVEEKEMKAHQLELLAEMMTKEGEIYLKENDKDKAKLSLEKALRLFEFVDEAQQLYSMERQATMQHIKNQLSVL